MFGLTVAVHNLPKLRFPSRMPLPICFRCSLLLLAVIFSVQATAVESAPRVVWDASTAQAVDAGVYGRVRQLRNGTLMLVYSKGLAAYARSSGDRGRTWGSPVKVASHEGYGDTNAELIELQNGWLLYGLNSRPLESQQGKLPYQIRTLLSKDGGLTWGDERDAYTAGKVFRDGCWEPAFLQLHSGEIHLYFANEAPYAATDEQDISLLRSFDHGLGWSAPTVVSFRAGKRDGMPVPLLLRDGRTLVCAIEDNGYHGEFKPVTIRSTLADNWTEGTALADSPRRVGALATDSALEAKIYAGAPYLAQLPSGETLLVVQSSAGRSEHNVRYSAPVVYVGDEQARDFTHASVPFPELPADASANWNSLTVLDNDTVMLVSSFERVPSPLGRATLWTILGRIERQAPATP